MDNREREDCLPYIEQGGNYINFMPKKFIDRYVKRYVPDHKTIRDHKHLRFFGTLLHHPNLWHLNRRSVPGAVSVGLFAAFIPGPVQMLLAAIGAIAFRVNLPLAIALTFITNPFTVPPIAYFSYKIGAWILRAPEREFKIEMSLSWLTDQLHTIGGPFLLGTLVLSVTSAALGNLLMRGIWQLHILRYLKKRKQRVIQKT